MNILQCTPENLAENQLHFLTSEVCDRLNRIIACLNKGDYELIKTYLYFSPAGDEMGSNNRYIYFGYLHPDLEDLGDVVNRLEELRGIMTAEQIDCTTHEG